jgi:hypothetical protein
MSYSNPLATLGISNEFTGISSEISCQRAANRGFLVSVSRRGRLVMKGNT